MSTIVQQTLGRNPRIVKTMMYTTRKRLGPVTAALVKVQMLKNFSLIVMMPLRYVRELRAWIVDI